MTDQHNRPSGFDDLVEDIESLGELYRSPTQVVLDKDTNTLDSGCRDFIKASTFVLLGTADAEGRQDVSPRGGPTGFVKVLDDRRLVIPDLNGNNRLDSIRNVVENPQVALLFVIPGLGETLRLNGRGCITTSKDILSLFDDELRRPTSAIGVEIDHAFIHCAKAFRRGDLWNPEAWPTAERRPSPGQIFVDHSGTNEFTGAEADQMLEASYRVELAADKPQ